MCRNDHCFPLACANLIALNDGSDRIANNDTFMVFFDSTLLFTTFGNLLSLSVLQNGPGLVLRTACPARGCAG
jgi:hypothetical protein